jgi:hydroxymethylbilane synthase
MTAIRLGTRRSALALAQSGQLAEAIRAATGRDVELVEIVTEGDRNRAALAQIGGTGVFVTALRDALLDGRVDVAVHSFKDLPTAPAAGLVVAAVPQREDPRDVLVCPSGKTLGELPAGARVGTGSPRRAAQLRALGFGLEIVGIRGNVDTRVGKAVSGEVDAVVLARAGLIRLGRDDLLGHVTEVIDPLQVMPAPAQAALAVETRADDPLVTDLAPLEHPATRAAVAAERELLLVLEAGCSAPVGALADVAESDDGTEMYLRAVVAAVDGSELLRSSAYGTPADPAALGRRLAEELLADGAGELMGNE